MLVFGSVLDVYDGAIEGLHCDSVSYMVAKT